MAGRSGGLWALPFLIALACSGNQGKPSATTSTGGSSAGGSSTGGSSTAGASGGGQPGGAGGLPATGGASGGNAGGGAGASGGRPATGGTGGATPTEICSFDIQDALSPAIPTVGIITWSTTLAGLTDARIEFTLDEPAADENVRGGGGAIDVAGQSHRALLLGLKAQRRYNYRIVARSGNTVCTSPERSLTTGAIADAAKMTLTLTPAAQGTPAQGFIVTTDYNWSVAFIFDTDGDVVWLTPAPTSCSRARMDWEGQNMWMLEVDGTQGSPGDVRRVGMDGTNVVDHVAGLDTAHHDLTVLPGGIVATLLWSGETSEASTLVERSPDGTIKTVAKIAENVFGSTGTYHTNSVAYHAADDTYTVGDLNKVSFAKLTRTGTRLWSFAKSEFIGNHGHHLLDHGILVFKARTMPSPVFEYSLTESAGSVTATQIWSYDPGNNLGSIILGDVQRLPNGNTLIDYSNAGEMREVSPAGAVVQTIRYTSSLTGKRQLGYADFRQSLYGPPPR